VAAHLSRLLSRRDLIDPESRIGLDGLLEAMPGGFNSIPDIVARRAAAAGMLAALEVPPDPRVTSEDLTVPGPDGEPDIGVRIYRPVDATGPLPAIYYIHGGGMVLGDIAGEDATAGSLCAEVGAVVVSVEYRLAPEHPHPAPVKDCFAGLVWTAKHASELGVDAERLAVYGGSAGGGLAIGTALLARDRGGPPRISTSERSTCSATRTSPSPSGSCAPASRPSCTSTRAATTPRRSSPRTPRCPSGSGPCASTRSGGR
jgi:acetyl esterase/lipase